MIALKFTGLSEDELRNMIDVLKDIKDDEDTSYPIHITSEVVNTILHNPDMVQGFVDGFITSRISAFKRAQDLF